MLLHRANCNTRPVNQKCDRETAVLVTRPEHGLDFLLVFVTAEPLFDALVSAHDNWHHHGDNLHHTLVVVQAKF